MYDRVPITPEPLCPIYEPRYQFQPQQNWQDQYAHNSSHPPWDSRNRNLCSPRGPHSGQGQNRQPQQFRPPGHSSGATQVSVQNTGVAYYRSPSTPLCTLCTGGEAVTHNTHECHNYVTPESKVVRLQELGRCARCTALLHQGECANFIKPCPSYPDQRHYWWLCCDLIHEEEDDSIPA